MLTVTPEQNVLNVVASQGSTNYIMPLNPRIDGIFIAAIPESSPRSQFKVTDLLDGTVADEYLKYDCDHAIISRRIVDGKTVYEGVIIGLTNIQGNRFKVKQTLSHTDCVKVNNTKVGVVVDNWTYAGMANEQKAEEIKRAQNIYMQEHRIEG